MPDLADPRTRAAVTERLAALYAGRPIVVGPAVLAGVAATVSWLRGLGCPVLVVSTGTGAGTVPELEDSRLVEILAPAADSVTDELRLMDRMARELPPGARSAVERFDPERRGAWFANPFVTTDEPIDGRPVLYGRPAAYLALEDKMLADGLWDAAGVDRAPYAVVVNERAALAAATEALAGPLGAVWSGDARDGFNGSGNYVRWVRDERDREAALGFFRPRCDRVRVMPFLEGVPCSIHGVVLPGGTAAFRPVEIATLRDPTTRRFVYGGIGTTWDPPDDDREAMRDVVRRVGAHLAQAHGYRGAFGVDGVLTADGFLPTELNTRMSAGATLVAEVDRGLFTLLQSHLVLGLDTGLTPEDLESLVSLMDESRAGKAVAVHEGPATVGGSVTRPLDWDGRDFSVGEGDTGHTLVAADTVTGLFAKVDPCAALVRGQRLATVTAGLLRLMDREYGTGFGAVEPAPEVRR
ncbi:hypothetical protein [Nocardioides sp. cx-173]|uniref:hypothetical protein n=1 Tax=Nocardioides sp. cx-173 TaxID=2898796 RepID=UPI001E306AD2|nr:hypothetical protein [Nocardioides sp. cx-173]MCD4526317.1 hypothetical protein [Nocardioides sp. cx-173]UGB43493.1 hypothetical protein LQ940_08175 [Nocardioides sp. cx-173]